MTATLTIYAKMPSCRKKDAYWADSTWATGLLVRMRWEIWSSDHAAAAASTCEWPRIGWWPTSPVP